MRHRRGGTSPDEVIGIRRIARQGLRKARDVGKPDERFALEGRIQRYGISRVVGHGHDMVVGDIKPCSMKIDPSSSGPLRFSVRSYI